MVLQWGEYTYKRILISIVCAPDIFKSIMMELLGDLEQLLVYIDDILIVLKVGESKDEHLKKIEEALRRLDERILSKFAQDFLYAEGSRIYGLLVRNW